MTFIEVALISSAVSIMLVDYISIGSRIKKMFGLNEFKELKPFDCLTCMASWVSIIISTSILTEIQPIILSFSASVLIINFYQK
jgi:hypothetical protein